MKLTQKNMASEAQKVRRAIWDMIEDGDLSLEAGWSRPIEVTVESDENVYILSVEVLMAYDVHVFTLDEYRQRTEDIDIDECDFEIVGGHYYDEQGDEHVLDTPELMEFNKKEWRKAA